MTNLLASALSMAQRSSVPELQRGSVLRNSRLSRRWNLWNADPGQLGWVSCMKRVLPGRVAASALLIVAGSIWPVHAQNAPLSEAAGEREPRTRHDRRADRPRPTTGPALTSASTPARRWAGIDTSKTTTPSPTYLFSPANVAAVNAAGQQQIKRPGFTGGVQAGYNWQFGRALLGIEADLNYLHMGGATTSGAVTVSGGLRIHRRPSGRPLNQFIVYSYADADWLLTLRPRAGITANNWLFYATGGLALTHLKGELLFADGNAAGDLTGAAQEADVNTWKAGYTVGGGVETAISDRLRFKAEYSFVDFPTVQPHETSSNLATLLHAARKPNVLAVDEAADAPVPPRVELQLQRRGLRCIRLRSVGLAAIRGPAALANQCRPLRLGIRCRREDLVQLGHSRSAAGVAGLPALAVIPHLPADVRKHPGFVRRNIRARRSSQRAVREGLRRRRRHHPRNVGR